MIFDIVGFLVAGAVVLVLVRACESAQPWGRR